MAIVYPPVGSLISLLDGFGDILDREQIDSTDIVGGSLGGQIAQALLWRLPRAAWCRWVCAPGWVGVCPWVSDTGQKSPWVSDTGQKSPRFYAGCQTPWSNSHGV
jgi:pimeloyl-ACP methyl ester carboxylesterase